MFKLILSDFVHCTEENYDSQLPQRHLNAIDLYPEERTFESTNPALPNTFLPASPDYSTPSGDIIQHVSLGIEDIQK